MHVKDYFYKFLLKKKTNINKIFNAPEKLIIFVFILFIGLINRKIYYMLWLII